MSETKNVRIQMSVEGRLPASRMVALVALGVLEGLKSGVLSLDEAERTIFGPFGERLARQVGLAPEVISVIHSSLFFEDYPDFYPKGHEEKLQQEFDKLRLQLLDYLGETKDAISVYELQRWLDDDRLPEEELIEPMNEEDSLDD